MVRIYKLHSYPEFPCDFPHTDFIDDLKKLFEIRTDKDQFNIFMNNHSTEYLYNLVQSHTPILRQYLASSPYYQNRKEKITSALRKYFEDLDRRKYERQAEQERLARATNGHTEPNGPEKATRQ